MSNSHSGLAEDPLVAALPPATDYLTYLTLLEYQLTGENLPTLNRLLIADDGTLAAEIGWDLLQIVLPILRIQPEPANECLQIIARRGNPREVVVRLAEELEKLARDGYDDDQEEVEDQDGLPTFAGEAPRVHLGDMRLDGMPGGDEDTPGDDDSDPQQGADAVNVEFDGLKFLSLMSMLPILQSRIKTQRPSRFLATSLPAVLGAYRRLGATPDATKALLTALSKLSGKKRPALPPRVSTTEGPVAVPTSNLSASAATQVSEPDPEARSKGQDPSMEVSADDKAITHRLLQAVLLEALDDYIASASDEPLLSTQLRVKFDKQSLATYRIQGLETMLARPAVQEKTKLLLRFAKLSKDLQFDLEAELQRLSQPESSTSQIEEPEDEYPTSPSQIPFSTIGLLILAAYDLTTNALLPAPMTVPAISVSQGLLLITQTAATSPNVLTNPATVDALLALLYISMFTSPDVKSTSTTSSELLHKAYDILTTIYTTSPHPPVRDNAAHASTHLFHSYTPNTLKITLIRETIAETSTPSPASVIREIVIGHVKAVSVGLLKDSIYPTSAIRALQQGNPGLPVTVLEDLSDDLFPIIPAAPKALDEESKTRYQIRGEQYVNILKEVVAQLPFYIAVLNLVDLAGRRHHEHEQTSGEKDEIVLQKLFPKISTFMTELGRWKEVFVKSLPKPGADQVDEVVNAVDVYALEDALGRALASNADFGPEED